MSIVYVVATRPQLHRISLGQPGIAWFRRALARDKSLSRAALANVNLDAGSVYGFFPPSNAAVDMTHFEGNIFAALSPGNDDEVGTSAADASIDLARSLGANFFVSQLDIRRSDFHAGMTWGEGVPLVAERIAFHGDEVFPWRKLDEASTDEIGWLIGDVAVVAKVVKAEGLRPLAELSDNDLWALLVDTRALLSPAYDDMSLLIWTPSGL